jgi:tetratricopeptide (TPR) repeat protein
MDDKVLEQLKVLFSQGKLADLEAAARAQLGLQPEHPMLLKMLGVCLFQRGEFAQAQTCIEKALAIEPGDANSLNNLGSCYLFQNNHSKAAHYFQQALAQGDNPEWHRNLGTCYYELGLFNRAAKHYQKAIDGGINDDTMLMRQIDTLKNASRFKDAMTRSQQIVDDAHKWVAQAAIHVAANKPQDAKQCLSNLQDQLHLNPSLLQRLHDIYRFLGDVDNEMKIVALFAKGSETEQLLASVMQPQLSAEQLLALEQDPRLSQCNSQIKATFFYILASHYKNTDKKEWLARLTKANHLQAGSLQIDIDIELECFKNIKQAYSRYAGLTAQQSSRKPVFIFGMPRSGTTLIESILGNHSEAFAAGESTLVESLLAELNSEVPQQMHPHQLRLHYLEADLSQKKMQQFSDEYIKGLNDYCPNARYITDKMPHNFMHLGWLAHALPEASFIHCERDPVSTCLSIFEQNLSPFHRYGNNLSSLAVYYQQYQELMAFWQQAFGERIISVRYDELVRNPKQTIQPVLSHLGLEWQDNLLDLQNTERSVTTSSLQQIRKGIYQDALNSYAGLEDELAPLMALKTALPTNTPVSSSRRFAWVSRLFSRP